MGLPAHAVSRARALTTSEFYASTNHLLPPGKIEVSEANTPHQFAGILSLQSQQARRRPVSSAKGPQGRDMGNEGRQLSRGGFALVSHFPFFKSKGTRSLTAFTLTCLLPTLDP